MGPCSFSCISIGRISMRPKFDNCLACFDKCLNSHFDDYVHSAGHYDDSREVEVEGETMVYEEVTLYYPRPNRCEFAVVVITIIITTISMVCNIT